VLRYGYDEAAREKRVGFDARFELPHERKVL
jgi:hypothetical protein